MNDKTKVIIGLLIFVALLTIPIWYNHGEKIAAPEIKISEKAKAAKVCVLEKEDMRKNHMQVLDIWRSSVVREGNRVYTNSNGKTFNMSLSTGEGSCIGCHVSKVEFCDKCHDYASVKPYCWDCHIAPNEPKEEK